MEKCVCCSGKLEIFNQMNSYLKCIQCGTHRLKNLPDLDWMKKFYDLNFYWKNHQEEIGNPRIEKRRETDVGDGRVDYWWKVISETVKEKRGLVVEVGCAHAILLSHLLTKGWKQAIGIEISKEVSDWVINNVPGIDMRSGIFPENIDPFKCDLFLAFDVLEHVIDPVKFVEGIMKSLNEEGFAIIQAPIDEGLNPPFEHFFKKIFEQKEHLWIFTRKGIKLLFEKVGFKIISNDKKWRIGHEIIIVKKETTNEKP